MALQQIINRTWAPASSQLAGGEVVEFYVNLRRADGLVAVDRRGTYRLGAVFGMTRNENGELPVLELDVYKGTSRSDAANQLKRLVQHLSEPAEVDQA